QGETPDIFIVLSGFATTDLSVRFCDACQGGGAYGKTATPWPSPVCSFPFPGGGDDFSVCVPRPLAAAERQERSD
ncbi:hypothetical protein, partial [Klebsiella pneumoniae]|uniref:hypothetical protein n=1 Tax=Klebsiella pneumoniae TaxID=573 RepID=UPI001C6A8D97